MLARALRLLVLLLTCGLAAEAARAADALVVITHPGSKVESMTRSQVINIFLGRYRKLPSGLRAIAFDNEARKELFYARLVNKTLAELNAYWARLTFSGQTVPPRQLREADLLELVASMPGALGYIDKRLVDDRVRIIHELAP